jgi:hypothetical protein
MSLKTFQPVEFKPIKKIKMEPVELQPIQDVSMEPIQLQQTAVMDPPSQEENISDSFFETPYRKQQSIVADPQSLSPSALSVAQRMPEDNTSPLQPVANRIGGFLKDVDLVNQARKIMASQNHQTWGEVGSETYARAQYARDYVLSLGGLLGGKKMREELAERAKKFSGFGEAIVPATAEGATEAIKWAYVFPAMFKGNAKLIEIARKMPLVQKAISAIESSGGIKAIAEKFPRIYQSAKNAITAAQTGAAVGAEYGGTEAISEGMSPQEGLKHAAKMAGGFALVAGTFSVASDIDKAMYVSKLRDSMVRKFDADLKGKIAQTKNAAEVKGLQGYRDNALKNIDNIVSSVEAELSGMTKNELYKNIGSKVEAPEKAAERFLKMGFEPQRPSAKGVEQLKTGMGQRQKGGVDVPITRTENVIEAVKSPIKTAKSAIQGIRESVPHPSSESIKAKPPSSSRTSSLKPAGVASQPALAGGVISPKQARMDAELAKVVSGTEVAAASPEGVVTPVQPAVEVVQGQNAPEANLERSGGNPAGVQDAVTTPMQRPAGNYKKGDKVSYISENTGKVIQAEVRLGEMKNGKVLIKNENGIQRQIKASELTPSQNPAPAGVQETTPQIEPQAGGEEKWTVLSENRRNFIEKTMEQKAIFGRNISEKLQKRLNQITPKEIDLFNNRFGKPEPEAEYTPDEEVVAAEKSAKLTPEERINKGIREIINPKDDSGKIQDVRKSDILYVAEKEISRILGSQPTGRSAKSEATYWEDTDVVLDKNVRLASHDIVYPHSDKGVFIGVGDNIQDADVKLTEDMTSQQIKDAIRTSLSPAPQPQGEKVGNWEIGQERPFKFDPNSTKNEGRFRLLPPDAIQKDTYFRRKSSTPGISYVMGKDASGKEAIQAIRFDKSKFTEEQATKWFEENKGKYQFSQPQREKVNKKPVSRVQEGDLQQKPVSKKYYANRNKQGFVEVKGAQVKLPGFEKYDMFIHKEGNKWHVSEGFTGMKFAEGKTQKTAKDEAIATLDRVAARGIKLDEVISQQVEKYGKSPRHGGKLTPEQEAKNAQQNQKTTRLYADVSKPTGTQGASETRNQSGTRQVGKGVPQGGQEEIARPQDESPIQKAQAAHTEKALNKPVRYEGKTYKSHKELLDELKQRGFTPEIKNGEHRLVLDDDIVPVSKSEFDYFQKDKTPQPQGSKEASFTPDPTVEAAPQGESGFVRIPGSGTSKKVEKPWLDNEKVVSPNKDVESFFGRSKRPPYAKKASKLIDLIKTGIRERFVTMTPYISNTPDTAIYRDMIRTLPEEVRQGGQRAVKDIIAVLDNDGTVKALDSVGLDLLRRKVFIADILNEAEIDRSVSGGFSKEELETENTRLDALIEKVPSVKKAYKSRQKLWESVSQDLLERGVLDEETAANKHYVRHFVLDLAEKNGPTGFKRKRLSEPYRAYKKQRKGSTKDISTDYLEVEVRALAQIYKDNAVEDVANKVGELANKRKQYTSQAKSVNFEKLVGGPDNVARIKELRSMIKESQSRPDKNESDEKLRRKQWIQELTDLDPTHPYRQRIAMHMSKFKKGMDAGDIEEDGKLFRELAKVSKEEPQSDRGMAARGVFKAMAERDKMIRNTLGGEYQSPERLAEQDGYVEWHYKRPNLFYRAHTLTESQIAAMVESSAEQVGDMLHIPKDKMRQALVMGRRKGMIIPDWLAKQLDDLPVNRRSNYVVRSFTKPFVQFWKRWILRVNALRYNFRNILGDVERWVASGQVGSIKNIPKAVKYLVTKEGEYYDLMQKYGAIGSTLWHEMNDVSTIKEFERFKDYSKNKTFKQATAKAFSTPLKVLSKIGSIVQNLTQLREDILRAAVFINNYDKLKEGKPVRHWAGKLADINEIAKTDKARAASKISRETLGDYGNFTPFEEDYLRQGIAPFYSWMKINTVFWPRTMINAAKEGQAGKGFVYGTAGAGINLSKWLIRVLWVYAAAHLWNHRDEKARKKEESLAFWQRSMPHVNIGDMTLWGQTALSDFAEWADYAELAGVQRRYDAGFLTKEQASIEASKVIARAPFNKLYQALNPFIKATITTVGGVSTYPNVFESYMVAKPASREAAKRAILDIMGTDAKKFYQTATGERKFEDTLYAYFAGWWGRPTDPDILADEILKTKEWSTLKRDSKTTGRVAGQAKAGKEAQWQEAKIREKAIGKEAMQRAKNRKPMTPEEIEKLLKPSKSKPTGY